MTRDLAPLVFVAALAALHLCGGREATSALAGIQAGPVDVALGTSYLAAWFLVVLFVAPWALARAGLALATFVRRRLTGRRSGCR